MSMTAEKPIILIVDDVPANVWVLADALMAHYQVVMATNGQDALTAAATKSPDLILLDIIMPEMDGYEVCRRLKADRKTWNIPVVFTTAKTALEDVVKGLEVGAYYYLTKPLEPKILVQVIRSALAERTNHKTLQEKIRQSTDQFLGFMDQANFRIQTIEDAAILAVLLANACPDPEQTGTGLNELLKNAVEHGNLGITYDEKTRLNEDDTWDDEIRRRMLLPENAVKRVCVRFERTPEEICFLIRDEGTGFSWESYLDFDPERVFDNHGRGIAMANKTSFDKLTYHGNGNEVLAIVSRRNYTRSLVNYEKLRSIEKGTTC